MKTKSITSIRPTDTTSTKFSEIINKDVTAGHLESPPKISNITIGNSVTGPTNTNNFRGVDGRKRDFLGRAHKKFSL